MGFIFKEKSNKLNSEEQKELIRALAEGLPADRIYDIFNIDKDFLETFIADHEKDIINKEKYIDELKRGE